MSMRQSFVLLTILTLYISGRIVGRRYYLWQMSWSGMPFYPTESKNPIIAGLLTTGLPKHGSPKVEKCTDPVQDCHAYVTGGMPCNEFS